MERYCQWAAYLTFDELYNDWQYASCAVVPEQANKTVSTITLELAYDRNSNCPYFDNISLVEEPAQTYHYDTEGRLQRVSSTDNNDAAYTYSGANLTSMTAVGMGTYEYEYDDANNLIEAKNDGVHMVAQHDSAGNTTSTKLEKITGGTLYVETSANYSASKDVVTSVTDANGTTAAYTYDNLNRVSSTSRSVQTGSGTTNVVTNTTYETGTDRTKTSSISGTVNLTYGYTMGCLTDVTRQSQSGANTWQRYHLTTDAWGNTTEIKVQKGTSSGSWSGGRTLASYSYSGNNGYLQRMTYGNGAYETYQYDRYGRTAVISHYASNNTLSYAEVYVYDAYGNTADCKVVNRAGTVTAEYRYTYDSIGRLIRSELIKGSTTAMRTEHLYDANNRLTKQSYTVGGSTFTEQYTYNSADGSLHTMDTASGDTITLSYDEIKRVSSIAGSRYTKAFDYVTAANGKTGTQISNLRYSGFTNAPTFCYTYTADGKIASETANGATWNYTYDLQGQLLSASSSSAAYSYTYDAAGNILTANGNTYTYGDGDWADLLTTYNGQSITYDTIGNPTSYYNGTRWTMSWANGRKLMSAASGSTSLSFTYDVSGLRETKTANNVTHTYSYAGGRLLRETYGNHVLDFAYDTNGAPYTLTYDGTKYYYITNVQGDVMRLIDTNGTKVAEYTYDPFGKVLSASGSMAEINPIRYRGYYYDTETGFYYLQSRYYDPTLCRFINADAFTSTGQGFLGNNMFAYCLNSPTGTSDSDGHMAAEAAVAATNWWNPAGWIAAGLLVCEVTFVAIATYYVVDATAAKVKEKVERSQEKKYNNQSVYVLIDPNDNMVKYVGRTNNPDRRAAEHKRDPSKKDYNMRVVATGLTKEQAILAEQAMISAYTLDYLVNARREIARKNIGKYNQYCRAVGELFMGISEDQMRSLLER